MVHLTHSLEVQLIHYGGDIIMEETWSCQSHCIHSQDIQWMLKLISPSPFYAVRDPSPSLVLLTFKVDLTFSLKPFWKCFQIHSQSYVSMVILKLIKLTRNINHHIIFPRFLPTLLAPVSNWPLQPILTLTYVFILLVLEIGRMSWYAYFTSNE